MLKAKAQDYPANIQVKIDSLKKELRSPTHDSIKWNIYLDLTYYSCNYELDTAISYCHKAYDAAKNLNRDKEISEVYVWLGYLYTQNNQYSTAIKYLTEGLILSEKLEEKSQIGSIVCNIGMCHDFLGEYDLAKTNYQKALDIYTKLGNLKNMAINVGNIASIERRNGNVEKALELYTQALFYLEEINDEPNIALTINNIGHLEKARKNYDEALKHFIKSAELFEKHKRKKGLALSYANLSDLYIQLNDIEKAEYYGNKSYKIAQEIRIPESLQNASRYLSIIYTKQNKYAEALEMYKIHIKMRDSLTNDENQKSLAQQQAKYEYEKQKAIDNAEYGKQIAIEKEAKAKQQIITYFTAFGLLLVISFLIFVFNRLLVAKKQKVVIETQKLEVEQQKDAVELTHNQLEEKNKEILDSITYAKRIQNAILPPLKIVKQHLENSFIFYQPKDIVAGDFYWMEPIGNKILFAAADCTGHGVPGAMVSVVCNNGLNRSVREYGLSDPGEILDKTRDIVISEFAKSEDEVKDGMDIALCSLEKNKLKYAGAHNPLWIIRKDANQIEEIKANKQPIGQFDNVEPYTTHTIDLQEGDSFYIFSDGFADQFGGEKGKKFKTNNFKKLLLSFQNETMDKQLEMITNTFLNWKGDLEQLDDICIIGVRI